MAILGGYMMILRYKLGLPINPQKDAEKLETSKKAGGLSIVIGVPQ